MRNFSKTTFLLFRTRKPFSTSKFNLGILKPKDVTPKIHAIPVQLYPVGAEDGPIGADYVVNSFEPSLGKPYPYVTKYPERTLESVLDEYTAVLSFPQIITEDEIDIAMGFGYEDREEARTALTLQGKPLIVKDSNGKKRIDWEQVIKQLGQTKVSSLLWTDLKETVESIEKQMAENELISKTPDSWDWHHIAGIMDEEAAFEFRKLFREHCSLVPKWDQAAVNAKLIEYTKPRFEQSKDLLIELLPEVKEIVAGIVKHQTLLTPDKYGLSYNHKSFEYIDEHMPEVRDRIIQEIDEGYFEFKYKDELRELEVHTIEDAMAFTRKKELKIIEDIEAKIKKESAEIQVVEDPRKAELNKLMREVQEQHLKNKSLENEIVNLKTTVEMILAARAKAERARGAKEGKLGKKKKETNPIHEAAWSSFVNKHGIFVEELEDGTNKLWLMQPDGTKVVHPDWLQWKADKEAAAVEQQKLLAQQQKETSGEQEEEK